MKYVTLIVFTLSLVAFGHASGDVVIDGFAKYIRANENRMEMIVFELRTLDICTIANTGEKLSVRDVKLELSDEMGAMIRDADTPRLAEARFRCQIVTNDDPLRRRK